MKKLLLLITLLVISPLTHAAEPVKPQARTLIALYDSTESNIRMTFTHRFLEMPSNHLGFNIIYYDVNKPLPQITEDVAGVIIWFSPGYSVPDADSYLNWLDQVVAHNKKLVILENAGMGDKHRSKDKAMQHFNSILSYIGMQDSDQWNAVTYRTRVVYMDNSIAGFERPIGPVLPPFGFTHVIPGKAQSHLKMIAHNKEEDEAADIIITSPNGGFVGEGYAIFQVVEKDESRIIQWFINPFLFLEKALDVQFGPVPDVTTLYGKRIFYSHIDGDGWNNICEIPKYAKDKTLSAEVVRKEILEPYSDFAFSVGLIIDDIDLDCYGVGDSEKVARDIYKLSNVEASSHTHSHPLYWGYFANYSPDKEKGILNRYPTKPKLKGSMLEDIKHATSEHLWEAKPADDQAATNAQNPPDPKAVDSNKNTVKDEQGADEASQAWFEHKHYETPRSYACSPFDLNQEIGGSISRVNQLTPAGKKAKLIQWSGDTSPFEAALKATREGGYLNINGGDSRFDAEYPSYSSVAPIGLKVGNERQIYSSNSNENTYTNLWTGRFFGFRYLQKTVENTETPIRVSPFNIYFHIYSGQKMASLRAVKENLAYARTQNIIPITTSHYAEIANSFYATEIIPLTHNRWKITNNGKLQTLRFDHAFLKAIDFEHSSGVIGQNYFQGSLYALLDPSAKESIIQLTNIDKYTSAPTPSRPYLVESSWLINDLQYVKNLLIMYTQGFGPGKMKWQMPKAGEYTVKAFSAGTEPKKITEMKAATDKEGVLTFTIESKGINEETQVTIEPAN